MQAVLHSVGVAPSSQDVRNKAAPGVSGGPKVPGRLALSTASNSSAGKDSSRKDCKGQVCGISASTKVCERPAMQNFSQHEDLDAMAG